MHQERKPGSKAKAWQQYKKERPGAHELKQCTMIKSQAVKRKHGSSL